MFSCPHCRVPLWAFAGPVGGRYLACPKCAGRSCTFAGWVSLQLVYATIQADGASDISAGAHLGGAAVGLALGFLARRGGGATG